jgi:lactoylglutathione lyase
LTESTSAPSLGAMTLTFGIILRTEKFDKCVSFYRDTLGLPVWYEKPGLVCLKFGDGYLMIETGGMARSRRKTNSENSTILRFNVADVLAAASALQKKQVGVLVKTFEWGTVGTFFDPDGNTCELKDTANSFFNLDVENIKPR